MCEDETPLPAPAASPSSSRLFAASCGIGVPVTPTSRRKAPLEGKRRAKRSRPRVADDNRRTGPLPARVWFWMGCCSLPSSGGEYICGEGGLLSARGEEGVGVGGAPSCGNLTDPLKQTDRARTPNRIIVELRSCVKAGSLAVKKRALFARQSRSLRGINRKTVE